MKIRELFNEAVNQAYSRSLTLEQIQSIVKEEYEKIAKEDFEEKVKIFLEDLQYRGYKMTPKAQQVYQELFMVYYEKYTDNKKPAEMRRELVRRTSIKRESAIKYESNLKKILISALRDLNLGGYDSSGVISLAISLTLDNFTIS